MSSYQDYTTASHYYDDTRLPVGLEIILGGLASLARPWHNIRLLDAGCGTGSYAQGLLPWTGHIAALDLNPAMLAVARAKLDTNPLGSKVQLVRGSIDELPFADGAYDAITVNQVLHHLARGDDPTFMGHRRVIRELHRALKPGGLVVLNVTARNQLRRGFWYYRLIPQALSSAVRRCPPLELLCGMLVEHGFQSYQRIVPIDALLQGRAYFDCHGPLRPEWRLGDSIWALASAEETRAAQLKIQNLIDREELDHFVQTHDQPRGNVGQCTFFMARKE